MDTTRRRFLKTSGGLAGGAALAGLVGTEAVGAAGPVQPLRRRIGETTSICPFCAVGCGLVAAAEGGRVINVEGDPDHPINEGALCSKGAGIAQISNSDRRLRDVWYRAPGATEWETKSWDWALDTIADRLKATRDQTWLATDAQGRKVNRTEAIASLGSAAIDNEECYVLVKAMRALGLVYIEHCARL